METESHWDHICLTITTCSFLTPTGESGPNQQCTQALLGENSITMTTTLTRPETEYSQSQSGMAGGRSCEGCPRCKDAANAGFCKQIHKPEYGNLHPVCRRCGHCVLRGQHNDDTSDLEQNGSQDGSQTG